MGALHWHSLASATAINALESPDGIHNLGL
jgi:hypothetical protein